MAEDEQEFRAEYSKSSRAGCKVCGTNIQKDVLRLAIMVQSHHFDGKQPNWFHFECFWKRGRPVSHQQFGGFDSLRWDDQQKLKDRLAGKGGSGSSGGGKKGKGDSGPVGGFNYKDYNTEYAKTGKSKCRGCEDFIPKSEVRISKKDYTSQRALQYGPCDLWYHVDCFIKERDDLEFGSDKDITQIHQFPCLKKEDKDMLIQKFGKPTKAPVKRKAETSGNGSAAKAMKVEESAEEKALKKQNEAFWKCRDTIEKSISKDAMKGLLEYNDQDVPSGDSRILDRLADCMTFGALEKCRECKNGQFVFSSTGYHCHGNLTEWTKCQNVTKEPKRRTFKIPKEYFDVDYLKNYKGKKEVRLFPRDGGAAVSAASALNETKKLVDKDKPLKGMKFVILGISGTEKKNLTAKVKELGGDVATKIDLNVAAVISTKDEIAADSKKIQEARGFNVQVLSQDFISEIKGGDLPELLKKHRISDWGEFTKPVPRKSVQQMKSAAKDAAMFTKSVPSTMKMTVKGGSAVDPESGLSSGYHVLKEGSDLYSEVLNMVDVMKGTNSYYKLQLLESDSGSSYYIYRSWGRVGTTIGGDKKEQFYSKEKAKQNFFTLYAEKTGNEWWNRAHFQKHPNKFYPLDMDYGQDDEKIKSLNDAGSKSKLAKSIQDIIKMIFDVESMKKAMVEYEIDLKKMPLGKLSKKQVEKAYSVLTEVQDLLKNGGSATRFLDCSNRFYTLIPHDFGMEKPPLIDNEELLKKKTGMLDSLLEIEVAYSLLKSSDSDDKDPIDIHYEQLKTDFEVLDKSTDEYKRLVEYVKNTHGVTHDITMEVDEIFAIKRHKEAARYKPFKKLHNRMLLWHGSRTTNYAGILSQGLRIAPPEAPVTGYMFGKGVYFADMASKSANYCRTTRSNPTGLMLLCEVALGTMYERERAEMITKLPAGCHSCKGIGRTEPDKSGFYTTDDGVVYPMGKGQSSGPSSTSLLYNEYIVYDTAQINMKYLLRMKIKPSY